MEKSKKVLILSTIVLAGFVSEVIVHYILGFYFRLGHFYNTFLSAPEMAFSDFIGVLSKIKSMNPYSLPANWQNYFPLSFIILFPFTFIKNAFVAYCIFTSFFMTFFITLNIKFLNCENLSRLANFQNIFILTLLSYPILYVIDRGNIDMIIFIFFACFAYFFNAEKYKLSAICLAIVNAMKPFAFLFWILFLFKKRYKECLLSILTTIVLIIAGFMFFKGNILYQFNILLESWVYFVKEYIYAVNNNFGMVNSSSLFALLKLIFCNLTVKPIISTFILAKIYNVLSLFMTGFIAFFAFKEKVFWKQLMLLTLYMALVPSVVLDYKLIFLFIPLWFFVNAKEKSQFDIFYIIFLGLLFIPKYFVIPEFIWGIMGRAFSVSTILNPIIMLLFIGLIIFEQFKLKKVDNENF